MSATPAARGYRQLLRHAAVAEMYLHPTLPTPGGLLQAVRTRYRSVVHRNLELPLRQRRAMAEKQRAALDRLCAALSVCHENESMALMCRSLSAGFGNDAYKATLFRHLTETPEFEEESAARHEQDAAGVAERQNRLMRAAVFPYLERLCILSSPTLQHSSAGGSSINSNDALLRALSSPKAGVTVQLFPCDPHFVALEIDESLNKQTIFVSAPPTSSAEMTDLSGDGSGGGSGGGLETATAGGSIYHQRVDSAQLDTQPGTVLHLEWMNSARRVMDALLDESALHRSRGTVIVGHGVAGAVAVALALLLQSEQFLIRNVVTFGAPKVIEEVEDNHAAMLNAVRVVVAGDPLVHLPVSGAEGHLFRHVGEVLQVHSAEAMRAFPVPAAGTRKQQQQRSEKKKSKKKAPAFNDDDLSAENLFAAMEEDHSSLKKQSATSSSRQDAKDDVVFDESDDDDVDDDDEDPDNNRKRSSSSRTIEAEMLAEEERAMQWPFSVLAYRAALADPDAVLEYFEEDAGVWDSDDIREAMHGHDAFQKDEFDTEEGEEVVGSK